MGVSDTHIANRQLSAGLGALQVGTVQRGMQQHLIHTLYRCSDFLLSRTAAGMHQLRLEEFSIGCSSGLTAMSMRREDLFEDMIRERPDVAAKREECRMALRALKEALSALETLPADLISRINGALPAAAWLCLLVRTGDSTARSCFLYPSQLSSPADLKQIRTIWCVNCCSCWRCRVRAAGDAETDRQRQQLPVRGQMSTSP